MPISQPSGQHPYYSSNRNMGYLTFLPPTCANFTHKNPNTSEQSLQAAEPAVLKHTKHIGITPDKNNVMTALGHTYSSTDLPEKTNESLHCKKGCVQFNLIL